MPAIHSGNVDNAQSTSSLAQHNRKAGSSAKPGSQLQSTSSSPKHEKRGHVNGHVNGVGKMVNGGASQQNGDVKGTKRKMVWMDVSEDEDERKGGQQKGVMANGVNGSHHTNGHLNGRNKKHKKASGPTANGVHMNVKQANLQEQRKQLPIAKGKDAIIQEIRDNDVTVLLGETGSGKTTQIPQYLLESGVSGSGMIAVTQPRRVAATSLAGRVALEQNTSLGDLVGYSVRFDEVSSADTKIKYVTDGMLIRELLSDRLLSRYSVIIVDEAHERTLRTDLLISKLKTILKARNAPVHVDRKGKGRASALKANPLKVVIMSATLDAEKFSKFYDGAKILYVKGRQHPVQIFHTASGQSDYVDAATRTFFQIHVDQPPGDVLIFLPGQEDIESLDKSIQVYAARLPAEHMAVLTCQMFAALPPGQQSRIFNPTPANTRKCILATNIAETSITIPGIKYVIDTGKSKEKRFVARDVGSGFDTLLTGDITKSSAMQRAGRAGREGKGYCFRLYTEDAFQAMSATSDPEIRRCSLTSAFLQLKCLGEDLEELDFMDKPDADAVQFALKILFLLGALDTKKSLTSIGRHMASFPLEPPLACVVLTSKEHGCTLEILDIVSVLSCTSKLFFDVSDDRDNALEARRKFRHSSGDHMTILNAMRAYQEIASVESKGARRDWCRKHYLNERTLMEATKIRDQLRVACERIGLDWKASCGENEVAVLKSLCRGLVHNSALKQPDGSYMQTTGRSLVKIHPGSALGDRKADAIIYDELVFTTQIFARGVSAVPKALFAALPIFNRRGIS